MKLDDPELNEKLAKVRALITDVDGVLTDGGMYYGEEGEAFKKFNTKDGMGIARLVKAGLRVAIITGEGGKVALRRAEKLRIPGENVFLGVQDKGPVLEEFLRREGLSGEEAVYIGDDVNDLPVLGKVAVFFAPSDAEAEVRDRADVVVERPGGGGAVRDVADLLLEAKEQMGSRRG